MILRPMAVSVKAGNRGELREPAGRPLGAAIAGEYLSFPNTGIRCPD